MNLLPLVLYAAAGILYALHFARRQPAVGRAATTVLLLAAMTHTFVIGMQTVEVWRVPFSNPSRTISSFVWMLTVSYLYLELTTDERSMGVFILPIVVGLQTIPVVYPGMENQDPVLNSPWFWVHIASLLFAYASFALAGVLGITYMLQFKEIKKKQLGYLYQRLPSLQVLDVMNSRAVMIGWLLLTVGVAVGWMWSSQARAADPDHSNLQAMSLNDPKILIATMTWVLYSFAMLSRRALGWSGRRAAWLSALGFAIVLLNLLPVSYFVETSHTFQ